MNEFRKDPITKQWVIISSDRQRRPNQYKTSSEAGSLAQSRGGDDCPFCAEQMDTPPIIARYGGATADDWNVCVVSNLYPAFEPGADAIMSPGDTGFLTGAPAHGLHEVVIESPTHCESPSELTVDQVICMLQAYRDRILALRKIPGVQHVLAIKNAGRDAGASLRHAHSQIFGLPLIPERIERELHGFAEYRQQQDRCVLCDLMQAELADGRRLVVQTEEFAVWCPYASRFNYEFWVAPREHQSCFEDSGDALLQKLGELLVRIFDKLDQNPHITAYNYLLHSQPFDTDRQDHYHWHIEFLPRIAKQAGFEWGTGIHINTVEPAQAASELRFDWSDH